MALLFPAPLKQAVRATGEMARRLVLAAPFPTGDVIKSCLFLIGAVGVLGVLVWWARRLLLPRRDDGLAEEWSLQCLRDLRADGRITDQEFEALKQRLLASMRGTKERKGGAGGRGSRRAGSAGVSPSRRGMNAAAREGDPGAPGPARRAAAPTDRGGRPRQ